MPVRAQDPDGQTHRAKILLLRLRGLVARTVTASPVMVGATIALVISSIALTLVLVSLHRQGHDERRTAGQAALTRVDEQRVAAFAGLLAADEQQIRKVAHGNCQQIETVKLALRDTLLEAERFATSSPVRSQQEKQLATRFYGDALSRLAPHVCT